MHRTVRSIMLMLATCVTVGCYQSQTKPSISRSIDVGTVEPATAKARESETISNTDQQTTSAAANGVDSDTEESQEGEAVPEAAKQGTWTLDSVSQYPVSCHVQSPTVFTYQGVRCRLLGVSAPTDVETHERALQFVRQWLEEGEDAHILEFCNDTGPLVEPDGTCVVWACRWQPRLRCLNIDLVAAGLADVDFSKYTDYDFYRTVKNGPEPRARWREALDAAFRLRNGNGNPADIEW